MSEMMKILAKEQSTITSKKTIYFFSSPTDKLDAMTYRRLPLRINDLLSIEELLLAAAAFSYTLEVSHMILIAKLEYIETKPSVYPKLLKRPNRKIPNS